MVWGIMEGGNPEHRFRNIEILIYKLSALGLQFSFIVAGLFL
jgi:hypothetical protein